MIKGLENLSYKENLRRTLDLLSLEKAQGEHIPVFQCLKGSYRGQKLTLQGAARKRQGTVGTGWARFHLDIKKTYKENTQ